MAQNKSLYLVWNKFQRRAQSLGIMLDLDVRYYHYKWEEKGKLFKAIAYMGKFSSSLWDMLRRRPAVVFLQLAPTPLLYAAAVYRLMTGNHYISDCHNTMIYDDHWIKWPLAKTLLRRSLVVIVHNSDVQKKAAALGLQSTIVRDPLPTMNIPSGISEVAGIQLGYDPYVIIPGSMAPDEPIAELFEAARAVPDVLFVMTWYAHKLPEALRDKAPANLCFAGFLEEPEFNALYAAARAAIVLTTREGTQPSGASEAIALGIPLVVSDIATTRRLYGDAPIYVDNDAPSIAAGVERAVSEYNDIADRVKGLRDALKAEAEHQLQDIRAALERVS